MRTLVNKRIAECRAANSNISKDDLKLLSTRCIFTVKFYIEIKLSWIGINIVFFFFKIFVNADRIQAVCLIPIRIKVVLGELNEVELKIVQCDILLWIRIRVSVPLTNGSGPDSFFSDFKDSNKKNHFFCNLHESTRSSVFNLLS
jgi:hypothetical protein